jgi:hypothetical protein
LVATVLVLKRADHATPSYSDICFPGKFTAKGKQQRHSILVSKFDRLTLCDMRLFHNNLKSGTLASVFLL